jgi:hypothetical protein
MNLTSFQICQHFLIAVRLMRGSHLQVPERAAIMEFDGGLKRDEAERTAWALVWKRHRLR